MSIAEIASGTHVVLLECSESVRDSLATALACHHPLSISFIEDRSDLGETLASMGRPVTIVLELTDPLDDRLDLARWIEESRDDQTMVLLVVPEIGGSDGDGPAPPDTLPMRPRRRLVTAKSWRWPNLGRLLHPAPAMA